ncbi:hypothetical protein [Desulfoplanes formicivorans]|uniref:Thiamine biosynthesis protein ThiS n=1 Tax=Desulfoplanes formicivorans TaxID=1592317 RepID=A0A194AH30_9BACT|nr:hypothetical protein [Desulfoplanes formicivorans]GAU08074.1 hypothetical protein DPF_0775 [Desulfoplanes formicivorans]
MVEVIIEPDNIRLSFPKINSVLQLLHRIDRKPGHVLVIRDGQLLTPDRKIGPHDTVIVRDVVSRG